MHYLKKYITDQKLWDKLETTKRKVSNLAEESKKIMNKKAGGSLSEGQEATLSSKLIEGCGVWGGMTWVLDTEMGNHVSGVIDSVCCKSKETLKMLT